MYRLYASCCRSLENTSSRQIRPSKDQLFSTKGARVTPRPKDLIRPNQEGLESFDLDANPSLQSATHCPVANYAFRPKLGQTSK
ncbi:hypothetical protein Taro_035331 [Colocasia esculenta]|uniref:Uncharacterized protein n=1 Tax=Colocasia esculenta TaxID=4460 RepID=A0A843WEK8_COLES|nr:hypothetical protein [Colocasia esculenta]